MMNKKKFIGRTEPSNEEEYILPEWAMCYPDEEADLNFDDWVFVLQDALLEAMKALAYTEAHAPGASERKRASTARRNIEKMGPVATDDS